MKATSISRLGEFGQSAWLDYISRPLIETGKLKALIDAGLLGMTSNPTIFDKAISSGSDYDGKIEELSNAGESAFEIYDDLTVRDVQDAADIFRPVYEASNGIDGYVSLELNPTLAMQTRETIAEGLRLHKKVARPNVMLKVPSTDAGFAAVEELLAKGININVTLIFSLEQYVKTAEAFLRGMTKLAYTQKDLSRVASVASVFISRIDTVVDKLLDERIEEERDEARRQGLRAMKGRAAVANSKRIFKKHLDIFSEEGFGDLAAKGARAQRVLWGSTSTKNPAYSDIKYVTELIAKNTVNTIPEPTLNAFLDHGTVKEAVTGDTADADLLIEGLKGTGIDIDRVCKKLLDDGVIAFKNSFDSLLGTIEEKADILCKKA